MWKPVWGRVLVLPESVEETDPVFKAAKEAGLAMPEDHMRKEQSAQIRAKLIDFGGNAFETWEGRKPERGDTVLFDRHMGFIQEEGGKKYRIISDTDIVSVWESSDE